MRIYCADVLDLREGHIRLSSGEEIPSQVLLCGTGWVPSLQFFTQKLCIELGLPHLRSEELSENEKLWVQLEAAADKKVLAFFPQLSNPPPRFQKPVTETPYRLYNNIAPLPGTDSATDNRSIVFIGHITVGNYFRAVECQAMWATAYLDGKVALPSLEERRQEIALFTAWCRRRYLNNGERGNWLTFELVGYTDRLLEQLGLRSHRKGWRRDLFEPCRASDLAQLREEYIRKHGCDGSEATEMEIDQA